MTFVLASLAAVLVIDLVVLAALKVGLNDGMRGHQPC